MDLQPLTSEIWTCAAPLSFFGLRVGTRMTVVRLPDGALLLHSPIPLSEGLIAEINRIGPVRHIVCPNLFHHLYAGAAQQAWPDATLYAPSGLRRKRPDLRIDALLSAAPPADWHGVLATYPIEGCMLRETVFYHLPSRTLVSSDLIENFASHPHWLTRTYLRANGALGRPTWPRLLRLVYTHRPSARASLQPILDLPIERLVVAHGDIITADAQRVLREAMGWL